ncbi:autotransporter outer membrane beta-barrel domain-containing protein [Pseudomonas sp. NPDC087598]|uniref:autotransporter family protein n=1 Tax=Pseudomonas sp. NPDC087598 TaxID=3364440 RepID=UPI0037F70789
MRVARGNWQLRHDFNGSAEVKTSAGLINNGSIKGDAYVDANAVYGGSGDVKNLHVEGFLIANPGLGSPKINGNLTLGEGATVSYAVTPDKFSDAILVDGTATLGNADLVVYGTPGEYADSTVRPVLRAGKIDGEFARVSTNLAFMTPTLSYTETAVALTYQRNDIPLAQVATSTQGQALARSVDTPKAATINTAVRALVNSSKTSAPIAIEQLAAGSNANLAKATLSSITPVSTSMLSAMRQLDNRTGPAHGSGNSPRQAAGGADSGRVWVQALGHGGKVDREFDSTLKHATQGLVMGADWRLDEQWHVGLLGGKSQTRLDARQYDGDLDSWHLGAYAVRQDGPLALRLGATYASHDGSSKRRVAFKGFSDRLKGDYDANTQQAFAELGFNLGRNNVTLEPFASLGYQRYQRDSYSEKGGDAALKVFGQTRDNLSSTFGLRTAKITRLDNGMNLTPRLSAGWKHTFGELDIDTRQQLVKGGKRFEVAGTALDRNSLGVDAGLDFGLSANHTVGLGVAADFGTESRTHSVMGQWRMAF